MSRTKDIIDSEGEKFKDVSAFAELLPRVGVDKIMVAPQYYLDDTIWLVNVRPEMYYNNNNLFNYFNERKNLVFETEFAGGVEVYRFE